MICLRIEDADLLHHFQDLTLDSAIESPIWWCITSM